MNKAIIYLLTFLTLLTLAACGQEAEIPKTTVLPTAALTTQEDALMEALHTKYGDAFKLWAPEGMELYAFYIYADHAERMWCSNDDEIRQRNLSWTIEGDELVITGEWNERFAIDPETGTATSLADGREYKLYLIDLE